MTAAMASSGAGWISQTVKTAGLERRSDVVRHRTQRQAAAPLLNLLDGLEHHPQAGVADVGELFLVDDHASLDRGYSGVQPVVKGLGVDAVKTVVGPDDKAIYRAANNRAKWPPRRRLPAPGGPKPSQAPIVRTHASMRRAGRSITALRGPAALPAMNRLVPISMVWYGFHWNEMDRALDWNGLD